MWALSWKVTFQVRRPRLDLGPLVEPRPERWSGAGSARRLDRVFAPAGVADGGPGLRGQRDPCRSRGADRPVWAARCWALRARHSARTVSRMRCVMHPLRQIVFRFRLAPALPGAEMELIKVPARASSAANAPRSASIAVRSTSSQAGPDDQAPRDAVLRYDRATTVKQGDREINRMGRNFFCEIARQDSRGRPPLSPEPVRTSSCRRVPDCSTSPEIRQVMSPSAARARRPAGLGPQLGTEALLECLDDLCA
jgi:hypothetical protein